jgi:hypothetical protein
MKLAPSVKVRMLLAGAAVLASAALALTAKGPRAAAQNDTPSNSIIDFNRQIRPILSDNCFACHGPDEKTRKAKLRLDTKEGAFGKLRDDGVVIMPGKAAQSELIARITAHDVTELMPPPKSNKKLTKDQIELLRQWIDQGAAWSTHWAFVPPSKPALPGVKNSAWPKNPIDRFILARLEAERLQPSPQAERATLIRRVTLDLTGLPPTLAEVDEFVADPSANAYEKVVDRLLKSPRHGEHLARFWLDAARYGDTHGLHLDNYREMWPYRDWVIKAFNNNLRFDRFIVEQLAGDLLPSPTLDQVVATGFTRCHVTTNEGGTIEEEFFVRNVVDRIDTNGVVFFGLSVGCARCHDHRYDPISMRDYYQMFAFFNNLDGRAMDGNKAQHPPVVKVPTASQAEALERVARQMAPLKKQVAAAIAQMKYDDTVDAKQSEDLARADFVWFDDDLPAGVKQSADGGSNSKWKFVTAPQHPVLSGTKSHTRTATGLSQYSFEAAKPGLRVGDGDILFAHVYLDPANPPKEIMLQWNAGAWKHRAYWGENLINFGADGTTERFRMGPLPETGKWLRLEVPVARVGLKGGMVVNGWSFTQHAGTVYWDRAGSYTKTPQGDGPYDTLIAWLRVQRATGGASLPQKLQDIVKLNPAKRSDAQKKQLRDYFLEHAYSKNRTVLAPLRQQLTVLEKEYDRLDKEIPTTLVFKERADPKPAFILQRGEYDRKGDKVERGTPSFLPPFPEDAPSNRLGFAQWLVAPDHPLTSRVAVNRFWQQSFGTGLVRTSEDFGSQGEPPSHPELLDWLATQFMEDGWDVRKLLRRIVTSATYRQAARVTKEGLAKDPANRLLGRGPRHRLDAEMLRDQALFLSGLLIEKVGGPSVKPPQPSGLWEAVAFTGSNTRAFSADVGRDKVHRRGMYTFWKRTAAPPQMTALDAPSREACTIRRERTNTPLQALLLMNERQFVECARVLAERTLREGGATREGRLTYLFKIATARDPSATELTELVAALNDHLEEYGQDAKAAQRLISIGETRPDASLNPTELAAWTMLANLVLNLDEVISKG